MRWALDLPSPSNPPPFREAVSKPSQMAALFLKNSIEGVSPTSSVTHLRISCSLLPECFFLRAFSSGGDGEIVLGTLGGFYPRVQGRKLWLRAVSLSLH